jgi:hypothetical protein
MSGCEWFKQHPLGWLCIALLEMCLVPFHASMKACRGSHGLKVGYFYDHYPLLLVLVFVQMSNLKMG